MTNDKLKELATKCGGFNLKTNDYEFMIMQQVELQSFAQAVIADFVSEQKPVAYEITLNSGVRVHEFEKPATDWTFLESPAQQVIPLYALGVNKC